MKRLPRMSLTDYAAMSACYALVALLAVLVLFPEDFAAFVIRSLP